MLHVTNSRRGQTQTTVVLGHVRGTNVGSRDVNWREWLLGASHSCRRPTQCLPYAARDTYLWQPDKVHNAAEAMQHHLLWPQAVVAQAWKPAQG